MFKILLKKQLLEFFKGYFYDAKKNRMRSKRSIAAWFLFFVIIVFGVLGGMFTALSLSLCMGLANAGAGWLYFAIIAVLAILLGVFGAVFNGYSTLYLAKDNDLLLSLPIPAKSIIASRLVGVYLLGTLYSFVALAPALVVFWVLVRPGLAAVACGILLLVIVTVIVLCLSCLLGWLVAKISLKLKNRSLIVVLITVLCIVLYYVIYFRAQAIIQDLVLNAAVYGANVKGAAYGVFLFGSIGEGNITAALLFLGLAAVLLLLTWTIMTRSFLSIVTATGKAKSKRYVEKTAKSKSPFRALLGKEFSKIVSSPSYMLNSGFGILFMLTAGIGALLGANAMNEMLETTWSGNLEGACVLFCGVFCLLAASNDFAAPSVSLEGKSIWLLQSLPVENKTVLRAKASAHFLITAVPLAFAIACFAAVIHLPAVPKALMCLVPITYLALSTVTATSLGVRMANLNWTNEIIPIKQGGAAAVSLFGGWILAALFTGLYFIIGRGLGGVAYLAICAVLFLAIAAILLHWLDTKGSRRFAEL